MARVGLLSPRADQACESPDGDKGCEFLKMFEQKGLSP